MDLVLPWCRSFYSNLLPYHVMFPLFCPDPTSFRGPLPPSMTCNSPPLHTLNIRPNSNVWITPCLHHPYKSLLKQHSDPYSLRQSVEETFLLPDQMSKSAVLFQRLLCPASPVPPFIYVGELWRPWGESWLIVSSCNITGPSLRGQRLCTQIHNPAWNGIAATSANRYWITRLLVWPNFYALFMKD